MSLATGHLTFLQAMMTRGPLTDTEAKNLHKELEGQSNDTSFHQFVGEINRELNFVHLEIRGGIDQESGASYYGIINQLADEQGSVWRQLEAIAQEPDAAGAISSFDALNIRPEEMAAAAAASRAGVRMTMEQKQRLLDELVLHRWLARTPEGAVCLGIQSFLELRSHLKQLPGVPSCDVCNEAVIKGQQCGECEARMHWYCVARKFSRSTARRTCPNPDCSAMWPTVQQDGVGSTAAAAVEEEVAAEEEEVAEPPLARPSRRRRTARGVVGCKHE
eukprot:jgi/Mesen1/4848/ME000244S04030